LRLPIARLRLAVIAVLIAALIAALGLRLAVIGGCLLWRRSRDVRLRRAGSRLGTALQLTQALFELAIAILQLLVLAGELPQLVFQPLNAHFRIRVIRLRQRLRGQGKARGERSDASQLMKSG
jgi:hypothetical protein